ncbi:MAG: choice-of-anchor Q domain-containing protein, partial [Pseudobdellovibrionaceae bacterium]
SFGAVAGITDAHSINGGDPKFVNAAAYDYRLQSNSPAIDKGTPIAALTYDAIGVPRPTGAGYDIGAYEYTSGATSTILLSAPTNLRIQL